LVIDADDGAFGAGRVAWSLDPLGEGVLLKHRLELRAPATSPNDGGLDFEATFTARLEVADTVVAGSSVSVVVAPPVAVEHWTLGWVTDLTFSPIYMPEDTTLKSVQRFDMIRVRFQVRNEDDRAVVVRPRLEYRPVGSGAFVAVPDRRSVAGIAFYVGPEWVSPGRAEGGSRLGPDDETIAVDDFRSRETSDPAQGPRQGHRSMGANPTRPLLLPALSHTEVEFSIRPTTDAYYLTDYEFRIGTTAQPWSARSPQRSGLV
jgi:hypothetical protein